MAVMCEECKCSIYLEDKADGSREYGPCENGCSCCSGEELKSVKHKNCADLIKDSLASLNDELKELMSNPDNDELDEPALSVDEYQLTSICLSYGGPSSYLEIKHQGSDIISVTYRYSDWFDTATLPVFDWEPAYEYARNVIESRHYE